jgi:hypothetical protein
MRKIKHFKHSYIFENSIILFYLLIRNENWLSGAQCSIEHSQKKTRNENDKKITGCRLDNAWKLKKEDMYLFY